MLADIRLNCSNALLKIRSKNAPSAKRTRLAGCSGLARRSCSKALGSTKPTTAAIRTKKRPKRINQNQIPVPNRNQEKATPKNRAAPIQPLLKRARAKEIQKAKSLLTELIFCDRRFIKVIALFVVPVLTGTCGFVAASIPPKGGTTNTACTRQTGSSHRDIFQTLK